MAITDINFDCVADPPKMKDAAASLLVLPPSKELLVGAPVPAKVVWELGPLSVILGQSPEIILHATGPLTADQGLDFSLIDAAQPKFGLSAGVKQARGSFSFNLLCEKAGEGVLTAKIITVTAAGPVERLTTKATYKCTAAAAGQTVPRLLIEPTGGEQFAGIPFKVKITWDISPVWLPREPSLMVVMIGPLKVTDSSGL